MSWEDNLRKSIAYERLAIEAGRDQLPEATSFYRLAVATMQECLDNITDVAVKSGQVVRAVKLSLIAGEPSQAKLLAQTWLDREGSLTKGSLQELRDLFAQAKFAITEFTIREIEDKNSIKRDPMPLPISNLNDITLGYGTFTQPDILQDVAQNILDFNADTGFQRLCARALAASILIDIEHDPPQPYSPHQIAEEFGVNIELQRKFGICLTKKDALEFLGRTKLAPKVASFNRRLSKFGYERFFGRPPSCIGKKPSVFTYAEILHFEDIPIRLELPPDLQALINQ